MRWVLFGVAAWGAVPVMGLSEDRPPNVLLVMTDDQGWGDVRCHGNPLIDTPTLDLLAGQGARFDRFYVSPVCAPTRASLLTGRYHLRTGVSSVTGGLEAMRAVEVTLAEALRGAGYATGCFGKWHNGAQYPIHPNGQGFDEFLGFCGGHLNNYFDPPLERNGVPVRPEGYVSDALTDGAIAFIREHRDVPFLCYVPYNAPHGPNQVPDRYYDKYEARGLDPLLASVYGMVENLDENIARLLATLDELELADGTIVVFLTDNGANSDRYDGLMRGQKGSVHEGGVRVPLFVRWPGRIAPGTTVAEIAGHIDLMPTLLDLCEVEPPESVAFDGVSLAPLLDGFEDDWPDRTFYTHQYRRSVPIAPEPGSSRTRRYRYVREQSGQDQLYDMIADPSQERDIAEAMPELTRKMAEDYDAWFRDVIAMGAGMPLRLPVGHPGRDRTALPAPDAELGDGLRYWASHGYANDWITEWDDPADRIAFDVDVIRGGRYEVILDYTAPASNLGATVEVASDLGDGDPAVGQLVLAHDPEAMPSPDRLPRQTRDEAGHVEGEASEKDWAALDLGMIVLQAGPQQLTIRATEVPGPGVMDLKALRLEWIGP